MSQMELVQSGGGGWRRGRIVDLPQIFDLVWGSVAYPTVIFNNSDFHRNIWSEYYTEKSRMTI